MDYQLGKRAEKPSSSRGPDNQYFDFCYLNTLSLSGGGSIQIIHLSKNNNTTIDFYKMLTM